MCLLAAENVAGWSRARTSATLVGLMDFVWARGEVVREVFGGERAPVRERSRSAIIQRGRGESGSVANK